MYDEHAAPYNDTAARWWAIVAFLVIALVFVFGGLGVVVWLGGKEWARYYAIGVGILVVIAALFGGIYAIMALLVSHGLGLQRSNADLLHAHSQSGAQQARAVTEVIRGANQINAADAKTQQAILSNYASLGATYEKRLAELAYRAQMAEQKALLAGPVEDDDTPHYTLPDDQHAYTLPKVS